jgi:hypothetical protein
MSKGAQGRKPLSSRQTASFVKEPEFFTNPQAIPPVIQQDIDKRGLEARWIDYKRYLEFGNTHHRGWTVYIGDKEAAAKSGAGQFGVLNADGMVRRGSTVLAVRPKTQGDQHRAWNQHRANQLLGVRAAKADEMRQLARDGGADSVIDDSFDGDDSEDSA